LFRLRRFANLFQYCVASGLSLAPFGADPVFNPTSTLYNDQVNLADFYLENELSPLGTPYGFFPKKTRVSFSLIATSFTRGAEDSACEALSNKVSKG
jgi:hypothetical protein